MDKDYSENKKNIQSIKKGENFIIFILFAIIAALVIFMVFICRKQSLYEYTLQDVYVKHSVTQERYRVEVKDILKEKGKEDIYVISCMRIEDSSQFVDSPFNIVKEIPKSQYEKFFGEGNNLFSSERYCLTFAVPAEKVFVYENYFIEVERYSMFEEIDFSQEEIMKTAELSLKTFSQLNTTSGTKYDDPALQKNGIEYTNLSVKMGSDRKTLISSYEKLNEERE